MKELLRRKLTDRPHATYTETADLNTANLVYAGASNVQLTMCEDLFSKGLTLWLLFIVIAKADRTSNRRRSKAMPESSGSGFRGESHARKEYYTSPAFGCPGRITHFNNNDPEPPPPSTSLNIRRVPLHRPLAGSRLNKGQNVIRYY